MANPAAEQVDAEAEAAAAELLEAHPNTASVVSGPDAGETGAQMEQRMRAENAANPPEPIDVPNRGPLG